MKGLFYRALKDLGSWVGVIIVIIIIVVCYWVPIGLIDTKYHGTYKDILNLCLTACISFLVYRFRFRVNDSNESKRYIGLYHLFQSAEFRRKRKVAWKVLKRAIEYPSYATLLGDMAFVEKYKHPINRKQFYNKNRIPTLDCESDSVFIKVGRCLSNKKIMTMEEEYEHMLDDVVFFFKLLAVAKLPDDLTKSFDFYYDSWRPMLCWYALLLEESYKKSADNLLYSNPPDLRLYIHKLDNRFLRTSEVLSVESTVCKHPILKCFLYDVKGKAYS